MLSRKRGRGRIGRHRFSGADEDDHRSCFCFWRGTLRVLLMIATSLSSAYSSAMAFFFVVIGGRKFVSKFRNVLVLHKVIVHNHR